jgi:hypothetical protein
LAVPSDLRLSFDTLPMPTPDGRGVVAVAGPFTLALFDLATGTARQSFHLPGTGELVSYGARLTPDGRTLAVETMTDSWTERLPERVQRWLTRTILEPGPHGVVSVFDVASGRRLRTVERANRAVHIPGFAADGRSFWTVSTPPPDQANGRAVFERWSVDPPGPPWWLIGLTACLVGLAVADQARSRRKGA